MPCQFGKPFRSRLLTTRPLAFLLLLVLLLPLLLAGPALASEETSLGAAGDPPRGSSVSDLAGRIDELLEALWRDRGVEPAAAARDATFLRRLTLDLAGRIPTPGELSGFLESKATDKRQEAIDRLLSGPEFPLHFGSVLEGWIQGRFAGDGEFTDYLRISLREGKSWDHLFREILVGPWESDGTRPASRYLEKRAKDLDQMTSDTARVFFGVDITCAQCHDHPLVADWSQDHYYGMVSFFNRTTGGKGKIGEKAEGEVKFLAAGGEEKTAGMMFLSGTRIEDAGVEGGKPKRAFSRRTQLVRVALEEPSFLSRAFVNRVWQYLVGRGLVEPVDQMHSENVAEIPELLDYLAEDFIAGGYDIRRLVGAIARTRVYQLSSRVAEGGTIPDESSFAVAPLRPLSRRQLAFSLVLATGEPTLDPSLEPRRRRAERLLGAAGLGRVERYLELEERAAPLLARLDPRSPDFQSSATEALFLSNAEAIQQLVRGAEGNLADRLTKLDTAEQRVRTAIRVTLTREPEAEELRELAAWLESRRQDPRESCEQLIWSLLASPKFRFNH